jgi:aromatic ring-opening dioxygenase catalytic subunit (LigB family)
MTQTDLLTGQQPALYIPHGGGPCFFMPDPSGNWTSMRDYLEGLAASLPQKPRAILLVSAHWESEGGFAFTGAPQPDLVFDYYGFPPYTYELTYPSPGDPALAAQAAALLQEAGIGAQIDPARGLDHGVFVPMKVAFPDARIPIVEMSVERSLDPALHLAAGRALAPLLDDNVLIIGSGMSFHNMRAYGDPRATEPSHAFNDWLTGAATSPRAERDAELTKWAEAPSGRFSHPREEHLIPLMVVAGAVEGAGVREFSDDVLATAISGSRFG